MNATVSEAGGGIKGFFLKPFDPHVPPGRQGRRHPDHDHGSARAAQVRRRVGQGGQVIEVEGRALRQRADRSWADPGRKQTRSGASMLTPEQYQVLRDHATERPGSCALNTEKRAGTFSCAGCGQELFTNDDEVRIGHRLAQLLRAAARIDRHEPIAATAWRARKCTARSAAGISATSSRTVRRRPASATASTASGSCAFLVCLLDRKFLAHAPILSPIAHRPSTIGPRPSTIGHRSSVIGHRSSVTCR